SRGICAGSLGRSDLNLFPTSPRANLNGPAASAGASLPAGSPMTPSREMNSVTTSFLMSLVTASLDQTHRSRDELGVRGLLGVLEADARVEATPDRGLDEGPGCRAVAVRQPRSWAQCRIDGGDQL